MSLVLRQKCQDILDNNKLASYHIRISDHKTPYIAGECGKPLVFIKGVRFARPVPSNAEIEYAVGLIEEFVLKHRAKIETVIKLKEQQKKLKELPDRSTIFKGHYNYILVMSTEDYILKYDFADPSEYIGKSTITPSSIFFEDRTGTATKLPKMPKNKLDAAISYLKLAAQHHVMDEQLNNATQELAKCDI